MTIAVYIDTPYITVDEYARRAGVTRKVAVNLCREGRLPTAPREHDRAPFYINNALLTKQALERDY